MIYSMILFEDINFYIISIYFYRFKPVHSI
jgi:hypothetical protein